MFSFCDIDFETRSEVDITKAGAYKYATHPSTKILILGYSFDEKTVDDYDPYTCPKSQLRDFIRTFKKNKAKKGKDYKIRAFNSMFEYLIWTHVGVRQFGFPELEIDDFYCVMAEACAMGFPASLENCAKALSLVDQKDSQGKALIRFFCNPSRARNERFKNPKHHGLRFKLFKGYCRQDVVVQIAISKRCRKLTAFQYRTLVLTERMNLRGLPVDIPMAEGALALVDFAKAETDESIQRLTNGAVQSASQTKVLTNWLKDNGLKIPNLQAATIERILLDPKTPALLAEVLRVRTDGAMSSTAKYKAVGIYEVDGLVHDFIKYHIANTGRWGGRGVQIHNFPKPHKNFPKWYDHDLLCELITNKDVDMMRFLFNSIAECLKAAARGVIKAPEGKKFIGADYAQIEARVVMWIANCVNGLRDFSGEGKIYEKMAGEVFNRPYTKIKPGSFERDVGKETVLGCGFGMGDAKFHSRCVMDRGLLLERSVAKKAVVGYRERYPEVKQAWSDCEKAAIDAISNPGQKYSVCKGKIVYHFEKGHLFARLPSGRYLTYPRAFVREELNQWNRPQVRIYYYTWDQKAKGAIKWVPKDTWGGTLFQHAVQASAADVMAIGMENAEQYGYETVFTVHDESAAQTDDTPENNKEKYEELLCDLPAEFDGLPIKAEGFEGKRYKKF